MRWVGSRRLLIASAIGLALALAGLANGYRVEDAALDAQRRAVRDGVVTRVTVDGSLRTRQLETRVRFMLDGAERRVSVYADRPYTKGVSADIAYLRTAPDRLFIVGATPWTWWRAQRVAFAVLTFVVGVVFVSCLVVTVEGRRWG